MKLLLEHALPKRLDYLRVVANIGGAYFYLSVDGAEVQWFGRIRRRMTNYALFSDKEYFLYRREHPVQQILDEEGDQVIVKTSDGAEESWIKPRWLLRKRRVLSR